MAIIVSGASSANLKINATANAARVTLYDITGREISSEGKHTYTAANTFLPAVAATDLIRIIGSATKTIRIVSIYFSTVTSTAGGLSASLFTIKRSPDNFGGTFVPVTIVPFDSISPVATAVAGHYTANPSGLGNPIGTVNSVRWAVPTGPPASMGGVSENAGAELIPWNTNTYLDKLLTLRGINEAVVVNYAGAALLAGQAHSYRITWTEE